MLSITVKTTDPSTPVYAYGATDPNTYLDPPASGTYTAYAICYADTVDTDVFYDTISGKRFVVGTRPHGSGH